MNKDLVTTIFNVLLENCNYEVAHSEEDIVKEYWKTDLSLVDLSQKIAAEVEKNQYSVGTDNSDINIIIPSGGADPGGSEQ